MNHIKKALKSVLKAKDEISLIMEKDKNIPEDLSENIQQLNLLVKDIRNKMIKTDIDNGEKLKIIAKRYSITPARVSQIKKRLEYEKLSKDKK